MLTAGHPGTRQGTWFGDEITEVVEPKRGHDQETALLFSPKHTDS